MSFRLSSVNKYTCMCFKHAQFKKEKIDYTTYIQVSFSLYVDIFTCKDFFKRTSCHLQIPQFLAFLTTFKKEEHLGTENFPVGMPV